MISRFIFFLSLTLSTFYESESITLTCRYTTIDLWGWGYRCLLINQVIERETDFSTIDVDHEMNFGDGHVIWMRNENSRIAFFPTILMERFPNLTRIALRNAQMTSFGLPINCEKLNYIDLNDNFLSDIPEGYFVNCSQLLTLNLNNNNLVTINEHTFSGLTELDSLSLNQNKLNFIHANAFSSLMNLRYITLSSNNLETLDSNLFRNSPLLGRVSIDKNRISIISNDLFSNNHLLQYVNLNNNRITTISPTLFITMGYYLTVDLSNNLIEELPIFEKNSNIRELRLNNNKIRKTLSGTFEGLYQLRDLTLSYNQIEDLQPGMFKGLFNVFTLPLNSNNITDLLPNTFVGLSSLIDLLLSDNQLRHLNASSFASISLLYLRVERNQIESIDRELFNVLRSLETLDLTGNVCANEAFWIRWDDREQGILPIIRACSSSAVQEIHVKLFVLVLVLVLFLKM